METMIYNLLEKCRSYRRFNAEKKIKRDELVELVNSARVTASAANRQVLRYALFTDTAECDSIFSTLKFAGYLTDWKGPAVAERPVAYIVIASEGELNTTAAIDLGIAAEAITLTASERGIGSCMFLSFGREDIATLIPDAKMVPRMVIALGYPTETVRLTDVTDGDIKYYRNEKDEHIVPKRTLDELIIN